MFWSINWWWIPKRFFCHRLLTNLFTLNHNHTELHVWEVCPNLYFGILKSTFELSVFCKVFAAFLDLNSLSLLKHLRCGWEYRSLEQDRNFLCIKGFMCFDIWVWSAFLSLFFFFTYSQYILWIFMFFTLSHFVLRGRSKRFHSLKLLSKSVKLRCSIFSFLFNHVIGSEYCFSVL